MRLLTLFFAWLIAASAAAQPATVRIDGPAVKVGDTWMFNTLNAWRNELEYVSVSTVKAIDKDGIHLEATNLAGDLMSRIKRTRDFNLVSIELPGRVQRSLPFYPNFVFPLEVGKTWRRDVEFSNTQTPDKQVSVRLEAKVAGWESVTVPAGTFRALKIVMSGWYRASSLDGQWGGRIEDTLWYSPEVRNAVRYEYKDTLETALHSHEVHELVRYWLAP